MKSLLRILLVGIILISISPIIYSITVTTNTDEITFKKVLAGGYAEAMIEVKSDSSEPTQVTISAPEFIKDWFDFEPKSALVSKESPMEFKIMLQPPSDISIGLYETYLIINTVSTGNELTTSVTTAMNIKAIIEITDQEITQANIKDVSINDIEIGNPIEALITIENQGNIELPLFIHMDILDQGKNDVLKSIKTQQKTILPSAVEIIKASIPNELAIGKYAAQISIFSNEMLVGKQLLYFNIVEKGNLPEGTKEIIILEQEETAVPLSTNIFILLIWALILIFVFIKIKNLKSKKISKKRKKL